jgi:hypothetical protein
MGIALVYDFPPFDTGRFEGAAFSMANGDAELVVSVAQHEDIVLRFKRVRWHQFTALYNCSAVQVESAYFKLVELKGSDSVAKYMAHDRAGAKAYGELHHFRVFLDEHGCHELFVESANAAQRPKNDVRASAEPV